jgi:N-acetylglutamate synthase/N-acetylornithine aminotransferase
MSQLMELVECTKITLDNREDLVVDLSTELVEKDLQVEKMATQIQELEEQVGARENTIEVLEDQLLTTQQQLEEANCWRLVLKCYELRTRQHKMLNVNVLRPLKHYLP